MIKCSIFFYFRAECCSAKSNLQFLTWDLTNKINKKDYNDAQLDYKTINVNAIFKCRKAVLFLMIK